MADVIESVSVARELRPRRVAFLLEPDDVDAVRQAIAWGTGSWGGAYFPLVPVMSRRPRWWGARVRGERPDAERIVRGYLQTYDPDSVISLVEGYRPPVFADRLAEVDQWGLSAGAATPASAPLDPLVAHLHEIRFRFQEHQPPQHVLSVDAGKSLLGDVVLGRLAGHPSLENLKSDLMSRLGAEQAELNPELLLRSQIDLVGLPELVTPLRLGTEGFFHRHRAKQWTYVYFCSLRRPWDALELWNLRAAGLEIIACPLAWVDELSEPLDQILAGRDVLPVAARRLTARERGQADALAAAHGLPLADPPIFWGTAPAMHERPPRVVVRSDIIQCAVSDGRFDAPSLDPEWASRRWPHVGGGWINELEIHDDAWAGELAGVLPHDLGSLDPLLEGDWLRPARLREGRLVVSVSLHGGSLSVGVPTGASVLRSWLDERGFRAQLSDPGRTALEIARRLGGVAAVRWTLGPARVRMLEEGTRKHHLAAQHVQRAIRDDGAGHHEPLLWQLTRHGALRAGMLLECPRCRQMNFVSPEAMADELTCERCLEQFPFPHERPPSKWGYRPVGPFAVPRYASGAYPALLAVRVLLGDTEYAGTWAPSVEIEGLGELDFALWRRRRFLLGSLDVPEFILGEAKSYSRFEDEDVERLLRMRVRLRAGTACFATLRDTLETAERRRLRRAARHLASGGVAPIIVLTSLELWSRELARDLNEALVREGHQPEPGHWALEVERLCAITQQLHL